MKDIKPISPLTYFEKIKNSPVKEAAIILMVLKSIKGEITEEYLKLITNANSAAEEPNDGYHAISFSYNDTEIKDLLKILYFCELQVKACEQISNSIYYQDTYNGKIEDMGKYDLWAEVWTDIQNNIYECIHNHIGFFYPDQTPSHYKIQHTPNFGIAVTPLDK